MLSARFALCYVALLCLGFASAASDKQIKLEDIEKDTLKAAQQAKYEKQLQQQQQQQYQTSLSFSPQTYTQQTIAYQMPTSSQYVLPQQYLFSGYTPLASNNLGVGYSPSTHAFQTYVTPQYTPIQAMSSFQSSQQISAATQPQQYVMAFATPLTTISQQPYYQDVQYYPSQSSQASQYYYTTQAADQTSSAQLTTAQLPAAQLSTSQLSAAQLPASVIYPTMQQYLTYQPVTSPKAATSYSQFISTAPQTFPVQSTSQQEYTSLYTPQTYSSSSAYSNTETPTTFVSVKAPQSLVASPGQNQQYAQAHSTTLSPLQFKYLNSPQYLAQNYNTIQSSQLFPKGSFSSGIKSTVAPPTKALVGSGSSVSSSSFLPNSLSSSSSSASSSSGFLPFRSLPSKNFSV